MGLWKEKNTMADNNNIEIFKMQFQTLLTEFQDIRQNNNDLRTMQGQLDSIALVALGISIPVILTILDRSLNYVGVILLIPILFFAIAFRQIRHERMIMLAALYADGELRPKIEQLLSRLSKEKLTVLQWEEFLSQRSWTDGLFLEWLAICLHAVLGFGAGFGVMGVYAFIRLSQPDKMVSFEAWLLAINGALLIFNFSIALGIARQRIAYKKKKHYGKY